MTGRIIRLVLERNFGFIEDENGKEYFFHRDDYDGQFNELAEEMMRNGKRIQVRFDEVASPKGARAGNVSRL